MKSHAACLFVAIIALVAACGSSSSEEAMPTETPLLDPVEPEQPFTEEAPIFIPTCWPAGEIEELEEEDEDE